MDLFAHRLMDSIEIVGHPLRERELVATCCVSFIFLTMDFYDKYKDQDEQNKSAE